MDEEAARLKKQKSVIRSMCEVKVKHEKGKGRERKKTYHNQLTAERRGGGVCDGDVT
jgi:hypothetical protein